MLIVLFTFISVISGIILLTIGPSWFNRAYIDTAEVFIPVSLLCFILSSTILYFLIK